MLIPVAVQEELATNLPNATLKVVDSAYGHDGFLIEYPQINAAIAAFYMSRIVQLTTQIFSDEAAQQKAVEMIKKRDHNEMAVLFRIRMWNLCLLH